MHGPNASHQLPNNCLNRILSSHQMPKNCPGHQNALHRLPNHCHFQVKASHQNPKKSLNRILSSHQLPSHCQMKTCHCLAPQPMVSLQRIPSTRQRKLLIKKPAKKKTNGSSYFSMCLTKDGERAEITQWCNGKRIYIMSLTKKCWGASIAKDAEDMVAHMEKNNLSVDECRHYK